MFGKHKPVEQKSKQPIYIKSKLSRESLDDFVLRHCQAAPSPTSISYTTKDGRILYFAPINLGNDHCEDEFLYLLGQTLPAHQGTDKRYAISLYSCIMGQDGKPEFWTKDAKEVAAFVFVGKAMHLMETSTGSQGLYASCSPSAKPVIHIDEK